MKTTRRTPKPNAPNTLAWTRPISVTPPTQRKPTIWTAPLPVTRPAGIYTAAQCAAAHLAYLRATGRQA